MKNIIDKNIGQNSISVTKDKFMDEKDKKIKAKSLETIQRLKKTQSNQLKKEDNILIDDILFTDYFEVSEQDQLINNEEDFFNNWKSYGNTIDKHNVNTLNAS